MCACNSDAELARFTLEQKRVFLGFTRKAFHRAKKMAPNPLVYLRRLPANSVEFCMAHPEVYRNVYGEASEPGHVIHGVLARVVAFDRNYRSHAPIGVAPLAAPQTADAHVGAIGHVSEHGRPSIPISGRAQCTACRRPPATLSWPGRCGGCRLLILRPPRRRRGRKHRCPLVSLIALSQQRPRPPCRHHPPPIRWPRQRTGNK